MHLMRFTCIIINFAKMNEQSVGYNSGYGGPVTETFWPVQQSVNESNLVSDDGQLSWQNLFYCMPPW